jgi:hypothetical protein
MPVGDYMIRMQALKRLAPPEGPEETVAAIAFLGSDPRLSRPQQAASEELLHRFRCTPDSHTFMAGADIVISACPWGVLQMIDLAGLDTDGRHPAKGIALVGTTGSGTDADSKALAQGISCGI